MSRRLRRGLLVAGALALAVLVGGYLFGTLLLSSGFARTIAAGRASAALGLPVTIDSLDVSGRQTVAGFTVGDFLSVRSATVGVPLLDLARGNTDAGTVTLAGVRVELRVDKNNKILTPLPKGSGGGGGPPKVPPVRLADATLVIAQEGRPAFTLANVSGDLAADGSKLRVTAKAGDPNWGDWTATGEIDLASSAVHFELTNPHAPLRLDLLRAVPFVPPETWEQVHPAGTSAATVTLDYRADDFTYGVTLQPHKAGLGLPSLNAQLAEVAGTIRVGGPVVALDGVTGKLADGELGVTGKLDFGPTPSNLRFQVQTQGVDVRKLPAEWKVPKQFGGKLRGQADLTVLIHPGGRVEPRGDGRGELDGATMVGLPAEIKMRLRSDGQRFRFEEQTPAGAALPPPAPTPPQPSKPTLEPVLAAVTRAVVRGPAAARPVAPPPPQPARHGPRVVRTVPVLHLLQPPAPKPADPPATFAAAVTLREVDIAELLKRLEVKFDYALAGKVTVVARVAVPVSGEAPEKNTTVRGTFTSDKLAFEGLTATEVSADLLYTDGTLTLTALRAAFPPDANGVVGRLAGTATAGVNPRGDLSAKLTLDRVPLGQVLKAVPGGPIPVSGPVSGTVGFKAPLDRLTDTTTWGGGGELTSTALVAAGRTVSNIRLPLKLAAGKATLENGTASVEGVVLAANAAVTLAGPFPFAAAVRTAPGEATTLSKLVPELALPVPIEGKLLATATATGTLSPATVKAEGTIAATALRVGPSTADKISAKWALTPDRVVVSELDADVFKGKVVGSADVPFSPARAGRFDVKFTEVDAAGLAAVVPDVPVRLGGRVSGTVAGELPAGAARTATADLQLSAPRLTVQGVPAEKLAGSLKVLKGGVEYNLTAKALGGDVEVKGRYPDAGGAAGESGKLSIRGADLRRLGQSLRSTAPLGGRVDVSATFAGDGSRGAGVAVVRYLTWHDEEIAPEVRARVQVRDGLLELADLSGQVAGGSLRGRGRFGLKNPYRNYVRLTLDRADGKRLVGPFAGPDAVDGEVAVDVRVRLFPEVRGTAEVGLVRGKVGGVDVAGLRLPVEFDLTGGGHLRTRDAAATVADGRANLDASYDVGGGGRLAGQVRFRDLKVSRLGGPNALFGTGRATGRFDFSGDGVQSATDVSGRLNATLQQTDVRGVPVLNSVAPFLTPQALARPFDRGDLRGALRGGVFRLERLALQNDQAELFADGTVTLAKRLDLRVVVRTGDLAGGVGLLRALGGRIPAIGPIPVGLILDVSEFLSNRTVRVNVSGTTDQPVVRLDTTALLAEEAVRFFLGKYIPGAAAALRELPTDR